LGKRESGRGGGRGKLSNKTEEIIVSKGAGELRKGLWVGSLGE